jgi:orotate phosphoribosyltransferase
MLEYQKKTVRLLIESGALRFGDFVLKSGRRSPYFINIGDIADGGCVGAMGTILADRTVADIGTDTFDVLFGPAYKGIVLASVTAACLWFQHGISRGFCFDRKEAKGHGEGGGFIGCDLAGEKKRLLIIDDVITDGKTKIETIKKITSETNAVVTGILAVVDRMEKNDDGRLFSAVIAEATGVPVRSVVSLLDVVGYIREEGAASLGVPRKAFAEMADLIAPDGASTES